MYSLKPRRPAPVPSDHQGHPLSGSEAPPASRLNLRSLLAVRNGGGNPEAAEPPSPSPFPLTPLIQEAEQEQRANTNRFLRGDGDGDSAPAAHKDPPAPADREDDDPDHIDVVPGPPPGGGDPGGDPVPDSPHVLDGPRHRYYVGLVDLLGTHGWRRRAGGWAKTVAHRGSSGHSTAEPGRYATRMGDFLREHLL